MVNIKKIQDKMGELNMSKAQLIKNSGLTRVTIDKILSGGKINVDTLEALAQGLGVNVGFFFDDEFDSTGDSVTALNGSAASIVGNHTIGLNTNEHDELIRLRAEAESHKKELSNKDEYYKAIIDGKNREIEILNSRIEELKSIIDLFKIQKG